MKPTTPDTMTLLKELKHKRFNSELPSHHFPNTSEPLIGASSGYGFVCPYHPTQFVTNICVSPQSSPSKPLCPRCLQQHINSHQLTSSPTSCKLQSCDTEVQSISFSLSQKLSSCDKLKSTISHLNSWQTVQLREIQSSLNQFRASLFAQIEKQFLSLQKQIQSKWQMHTKEFNETVKRLQETMGNLEDHCMRCLKLIGERKQIDSICTSVSLISKKYEDLIKVQEKMLNCASARIQGKFSTAKISEIVANVKSSLQLRTSKVSGFQIDRILKEVMMKQARQDEPIENTTLNKLQKLFKTNSTKKLANISDSESTKQRFYQKVESGNEIQLTENSHQRVLTKLSDTGNKLKESLNTFMKGGSTNKLKIYA